MSEQDASTVVSWLLQQLSMLSRSLYTELYDALHPTVCLSHKCVSVCVCVCV